MSNPAAPYIEEAARLEGEAAPDPNGDYDPLRVQAELMRVLGWLSRGRIEDQAFLTHCVEAFARQRDTKAKRWAAENGAAFAHAVGSPGYAVHFAAVLFEVMRHKFGGETIWQRKRPKAAKLAAARRMTPKELMRAFGISRAHAYALRREALKIPRSK